MLQYDVTKIPVETPILLLVTVSGSTELHVVTNLLCCSAAHLLVILFKCFRWFLTFQAAFNSFQWKQWKPLCRNLYNLLQNEITVTLLVGPSITIRFSDQWFPKSGVTHSFHSLPACPHPYFIISVFFINAPYLVGNRFFKVAVLVAKVKRICRAVPSTKRVSDKISTTSQ